jgi:hypothetical protein
MEKVFGFEFILVGVLGILYVSSFVALLIILRVRHGPKAVNEFIDSHPYPVIAFGLIIILAIWACA